MTGAHDTVSDCADLFSVTLHDDNIQEFDTSWDEVLLSMSKIPSDDIWESPYKLRIREFAQLKTVLELYDMAIHQKISMSNYQKLKTMVKRSTDQKLRIRNFDARHGRIETGAVVKNSKGMNGVEGGKGIRYQWREKGQCSQGDRCSFQHESNDRAQKPDDTAATPSEPSMTRGRSVSKKRSMEGKCNHSPTNVQILFERYLHAIALPHHKVDEQPNKKPKKGYYSHQKEEKATTRMQWLF